MSIARFLTSCAVDYVSKYFGHFRMSSFALERTKFSYDFSLHLDYQSSFRVFENMKQSIKLKLWVG